MRVLRSERVAALLLVLAAAARSAHRQLADRRRRSSRAMNAHPSTGFPVIDLSPGHWITDGLLADLLLPRRDRAASRAHPRRTRQPAQGARSRRRRRRRRGRARAALPARGPRAGPRTTDGRSRPRRTSRSRSACSRSSAAVCRPRPRLPARARRDRRPDRDPVHRALLHRGDRRRSRCCWRFPSFSLFGWLSFDRVRAAHRGRGRSRRPRADRLGARAALRRPPDIAGVALGLVFAPAPRAARPARPRTVVQRRHPAACSPSRRHSCASRP